LFTFAVISADGLTYTVCAEQFAIADAFCIRWFAISAGSPFLPVAFARERHSTPPPFELSHPRSPGLPSAFARPFCFPTFRSVPWTCRSTGCVLVICSFACFRFLPRATRCLPRCFWRISVERTVPGCRFDCSRTPGLVPRARSHADMNAVLFASGCLPVAVTVTVCFRAARSFMRSARLMPFELRNTYCGTALVCVSLVDAALFWFTGWFVVLRAARTRPAVGLLIATR